METKVKKPKAKLTGTDVSVFALLGICSKVLKNAGLNEQSKQMIDEVFSSESYEEALQIMGKYVDIK